MAFNRKQKLRDNIEAIRTAFTLEKEQRTPTARERVLLERYCGFGGLKCILNPARELTDAVHWAKSDLDLFAPTIELHRLIRENSRDEREYKSYVDSLVEHLQDLYSLLHTHGDVRDSGIAVDIQAIALAQGKHLLARFLHLQDAVLCGLDAEDDVLEHGEVLHQHEVLMNHADTQRIGRARIFDLCLFAVHEDLALFRLIKAEQDAHQRRFTGAVLAQKGVDLAIADAQGDVVIRDDARKHLRDVQQLDRIVVHKMIPLVGKPGRETPQRSLPGPPYLIVVYSTT